MPEFHHVPIPTCDTSHPDDPIPSDPTTSLSLSKTSSINTAGRRAVSASALSRSSGASPRTSDDDSLDSDAPSTPLTELTLDGEVDKENRPDRNASKPQNVPRRRRASTQVISSRPADLQKLLGDDTDGTKFLQKYCCGGGCCMLDGNASTENSPDAVTVQLPDNDAYRALGLLIRRLSPDTPLTNVAELPETTVRLDAKTEHPDLARHESTAGTHPPHFVQPHAPYSVHAAPLYHARQLTKPGAEKRTYHFDLDITDYPEEGGVDFKVGGAIGICPPNDPSLVNSVFEHLGTPSFVRDKPVILKTHQGRWPTIWGEDQARQLVTTRRELLTWCSDISSNAPTKALFRLLAEHAAADNEKKILMYLASEQGQATFCDLRTGPHITLPHLLKAFPSTSPPLESLFSVLSQLMPRFYSLSNDPFESSAREGLAGRRLIEIAVTVHETPDWRGDARTGVGSGYLERIADDFARLEQTHEKSTRPVLTLPVFRGLMANPLSREFATDGPMMLIGAGVGMAPFRGFILNRLRNANCANKIWLIQGVRDSMLDEIYRGELGHHEDDIKKVVQSRAKVQPPPVCADDDGVVDLVHAKNDLIASATLETSLEHEESPTPHSAVVVDSSKAKQTAKYVQDEVRHQADVVWYVLNAVDGRVFVCGSTKGMGEGVEMALVDVIMDKGGLNVHEARTFLEQKSAAGQYVAVSISACKVGTLLTI